MSDATKFSGKLKGAKVLIIGGSSGLGFGAAEASIENGATVIISSSSQKRVDDAVQRIKTSYPSAENRILGIVCNLGDHASLEKNVVDLLEKAGKLDHIIHSAGEPLRITPLSEITVENAMQWSTVRFYAPLMLGKHAPKYMNPGPKSSFTITSGAIVLRPMPNWVLPMTTMSAVEGLVKALALELAPIRVNSMCPGAVETELWAGMDKDQLENFKKSTASSVPTGRLAQPEDVAEAYLYLMKDPNVTGTSLQTNSGAMLK